MSAVKRWRWGLLPSDGYGRSEGLVEDAQGSLVLASDYDASEARLHEVAVACATAEQERDALAAEVERLRAMSVSRVMLDVVPGAEGMGEEIYAKSVDQVEDRLGSLGDQVETLQGQRDQLEAQVQALGRDAARFRFIDDCPIRTMVALSRKSSESSFDLGAECDRLMQKRAAMAQEARDE